MNGLLETERARPAIADGKRRLIEAALKLGARGTSLDALGVRELAREARLNHNTFYRHFDSTGELGQAAAEQIAAQLMAGMKDVRRSAAKHADATRAAAEYFLDFVARHPDAFVVGLREIHSATTQIRSVLQRVLDRIAAESVEQIVAMNLAPVLNRDTLLLATSAITYYMFYRALDFIERPHERNAIEQQIVAYARMQFLGAAALHKSR